MKKSFTFWTKAEDQILIKNRSNKTIRELHALLKTKNYERSEGAIERRCRRLKLSYDMSATIKKSASKKKAQAIEDNVNWSRILEVSKEFKDNVLDQEVGFAKPVKRIVSLSDIHFPFQRDDILEAAVDYAKGADILVLNGDIFDCYAVSSFKKKKKVPLMREYDIVVEFVRGLVPHFPEIRLVRGNHEKRFSGNFNTALGVDLDTPLGDDLFTRIARGDIYNEDAELVGQYEFDNVYYDPFIPWYTCIGKTIFCHPKVFSRVPGGTILRAYKWFQEVGHVDFDCIVMGHTHQQARYVYEGKLLMEQGCLTALMDYQWDDGLRYRSQVNGFAEVWQDENGNTSFKDTKLEYCGVQWPPSNEGI